MADRLAASSTANVHAVLVARGGELVFERYFRGFDEIQNRPVSNVTFEADTLHDMKSVSKSVASLVLGIAIDRGLIGSVNEPTFNFLPELADLSACTQGVGSVSLRPRPRGDGPGRTRVLLQHRRAHACVGHNP